MTKKIAVTVLFVLYALSQINAQFTDDFERYNYTQRISPQSLNWITWSEDPVAGTGYIADEDGIISNTDYPNYGQSKHYAASGKQALFVGGNKLGSVPQDVVLDLHNKSKGKWVLSWKMYILANSRAYYNFQENTPIINGNGAWAVQVNFRKTEKGKVEDDSGNKISNFSYPQEEWFELKHIINLDNDTIIIELISSSGTTEIYNNSFLSNNKHLGGVDFYSIAKKNNFYIDDIAFKKEISSNDVFIWQNDRWEDSLGNALPGEPDNSYTVIIREPYTIAAGMDLHCLDLIFENTGALTVLTNTNVVVSGDLNISAGNTITVEDGGSFIMLNNTAVIDMPDPGSFTYTRKSRAMLNSDYTYWSSPVKNIDVSAFGSPYVYSFETANYLDMYSGKGYPQTSGAPDQYDDNGDDWLYESDSNSIEAGKGYAVLKAGSTNEQTIIFAGVPNNGFISVPVFLSADDTADDDDWNLMGNPYPSAIDARVLINSNINTSGTLYYWAHNTKLDAGVSGPGSENYNPNDYASFNLSGGVAASTGGEIPNGYIAAGQGFFMDVSQNGSITFNNDMRVIHTSNENTQFYKTSNTKKDENDNLSHIDQNRIWLSFTNNKRAFSQSLIAFMPNATDGYESNYDGLRAGSDLNVKFYSLLENKELAIQGRSVLKGDEIIKLGYYVVQADDFIIAIDQIEGLISDKGIDIYLMDYKLNISHNLKDSNYTFHIAEPGVNNDRFALQFKSSSLGIVDELLKKNDFIIKNHKDSFEIISTKEVQSLQVYDLMGRLLINKSPNKKRFMMDTSDIKKGTILLLNASVEHNKISIKTIKY